MSTDIERLDSARDLLEQARSALCSNLAVMRGASPFKSMQRSTARTTIDRINAWLEANRQAPAEQGNRTAERSAIRRLHDEYDECDMSDRARRRYDELLREERERIEDARLRDKR